MSRQNKIYRCETGEIMKLIKVILFICSFVCGYAVLFGQEKPLRVETNLVSVNVAVSDGAGKYVAGLRQEQFEIFDNRQKQQISHFSVNEAPATYGIVYDMHPTTAEQTKTILEAVRAFAKELRREDSFFAVFFDERGSLTLDFVPTAEQLEKHLPTRREPNSLYDAIYLAADRIRDSPNLKRTLIVVSDTADHHSRHRFSDLSGKLKTLDVQIYAIVFADETDWFYRDVTREGGRRRVRVSDATGLDRAAMGDLTLKSGGTTFSPASENSHRIYEIFREISQETERQYTISFYPTEQDGKWHDLRVGLRGVEGGKKFALTYRRGYQSPPSKKEK